MEEHKCMVCFRWSPGLAEQQMGNLPTVRIQPESAFTSAAVNYAGPICILPLKGRGRPAVKRYVAVFICLVTKAIHLGAVEDLTSESLIGVLHRFVGTRGLCRELYRNCGTNFVGANMKLQADTFQVSLTKVSHGVSTLPQRHILEDYGRRGSSHVLDLLENVC